MHVVIIGLTRRDAEVKDKRLFSYDDVNGDPVESHLNALSPYLFDATGLSNRHLVVEEVSKPLGDAPKLVIGSKPIDGGHYIFDGTEREAFLEREPRARRYMHPFVGSEEYINGGERWILRLDNVSPEELRRMPAVMERIAAVKKMRLESRSKPTRELAIMPTRFHVTVVPDGPFLCIPKVSSERREYVPIGWLEPPTIPSDLVFVLRDADLWQFAILTSRMHMAWLRYIGGRLESRYRYSIGIVYNPFPWPQATETQRQRIRRLAQAVLDARALFPSATLADLYDTNVMKPELRRAHRALDAAVDSLYRSASFGGDRERVEHLFALYDRIISPLTAATKQNKGRGRRPKSLA